MLRQFRTGLALLASAAFVFSGQAWAGNPGTLIQVVKQFPTVLSITASPGSAVAGSTISFHSVLSAAKAGPPTGSVIFTLVPPSGIATTISRAIPVSGDTASWSITPPEGQSIVTASYTGDANYAAASASTTITLTTPPGKPDFDFSMSPLKIARGNTAAVAISITPENGFTGAIHFSCGQLPGDITCSFSQPTADIASSLSPHSPTAASVVGEIGTEAPTIAAISGTFLLFGFAGFEWRKKRAWLKALIGGAALAAMIGCGVQNRFTQSGGTAIGTFHIPITATCGPISHTRNLTVTVTN